MAADKLSKGLTLQEGQYNLTEFEYGHINACRHSSVDSFLLGLQLWKYPIFIVSFHVAIWSQVFFCKNTMTFLCC